MIILFLNLQITRSDVRPHIKCIVSLVIAYGPFNLPQGFVWVCMDYHTHFIAPEGREGILHTLTQKKTRNLKYSEADQLVRVIVWISTITYPQTLLQEIKRHLQLPGFIWFYFDLSFDLVMCNIEKKYDVIHDTEYLYWNRMSLNNILTQKGRSEKKNNNGSFNLQEVIFHAEHRQTPQNLLILITLQL